MNSRQEFRFAFAGVLLALLLALVNKDSREAYDREVMLSLAIAIPAATFRGLVAGHPGADQYKAASGFAAFVSFLSTIAAFSFLFAGRDKYAGAVFMSASIASYLALRFGKRGN